jgi:hypothetical protein
MSSSRAQWVVLVYGTPLSSNAERKFPSDRAYRRTDRGIAGVLFVGEARTSWSPRAIGHKPGIAELNSAAMGDEPTEAAGHQETETQSIHAWSQEDAGTELVHTGTGVVLPSLSW